MIGSGCPQWTLSISDDENDKVKNKFIKMDGEGTSSFNSNTRTMSLTHLLLDHHLSGAVRVSSELTTKQALLFCASHQNILNGEFTNWESWIQDGQDDKKRKVTMHRLGSGTFINARPYDHECYNDLETLVHSV